MTFKRFLFLPAFLVASAFGVAIRADDPTPVPDAPKVVAPAPVAKAPDSPAAPSVSAAAPAPEKPVVTVQPSDDEKNAAKNTEDITAAVTSATPAPAPDESKPRKGKRHHRHGGPDEEPPVGDHAVAAGARGSDTVSIFGTSQVDGDIDGDAVSVFGDTIVNGSVSGDAVSVFGPNEINGKVGAGATSVFGSMTLGPKAEVDGDVNVVFGNLQRDPAAQIHGQINHPMGALAGFGDFHWLRAYMEKCLMLGRPLGIGAGLGWVWVGAGIFFLFYFLLVVLFPRGIERCVETLEQRPGGTAIAALLTLLLTPILFLILCITVIGIPLIPVAVAAMFVATAFGKASIEVWLGRRLAAAMGRPVPSHVISLLMGAAFVCLLYLVPFLGLVVWKLLGSLGLGLVVFRLVQSSQRKPKPVVRPAAPAIPSVTAPASPMPSLAPVQVDPTVSPAASPTPVDSTLPPPVPAPTPSSLPPFSATMLPRAGFWIRIAAAFLDLIVVGMSFAVLHHVSGPLGDAFPLWFAAYHIIMWGTKGATVGGIVCGLKVVRLDDRKMDWGTAIVRALGAFLSLAVAGLGFIWVAFDADRQSWHDKIAGTTVVFVPKGTPLL